VLIQSSRRDRDAGNAALELVILAPVILFLLGLVIAAGRTSVAQGSVAAAARDAARQASISLTPSAAQTAALSSAQAALGQDGLNCDPVVTVNVSGFGVPVGEPANVQATVTFRATFRSPLDPYRGR
jgi:Flp pilus assembly protein TadG